MTFTIGDYLIDTDTHELFRDGLPQKIEPLIFKLLLFMLQNSDRVLSRDELIKGVWKSHVISDSALSAAISTTRNAIGDNGKKQRCIKTVSGSGYRFIAPFKCTESLKTLLDTGSSSVEAPIVPAVTLELPDTPSLAVMNFIDIDNHQSLLATGLTTDINAALSRQPHFFVIARASAHNISKKDLAANEAGECLGVRYLIYGNVKHIAKRIRVSISIVDAMNNTEIWSEHFDRTFDDFFQMQDDITNAVVKTVDSRIEQAEIKRSFIVPTENLSAWENYHRGLWYIDRTSIKDVDSAQFFFKKAIKQDNRFSRAFAGLAYTYTSRRLLDHSMIKTSDQDIVKSMDYAQRSIDFCSNEVNGYMSLGRALVFSNKVPQALVVIENATELSPNNAQSHILKALSAIRLGKSALCLESLEKAERLNSHSDTSLFQVYMARTLLMLDLEKYDDAAYFSTLAIHHNSYYFLIYALAAACHQLANKRQKAVQYAAQALVFLPSCTIDSCQRVMSCSKKHRELFTKALVDAGIPKVSYYINKDLS
ncbi:MAG: winged helix-turn-helix domain-containing protein [Methylococcales bacterium]